MSHPIDPQGDCLPVSYLPIPDMLVGWPWQQKMINPLYEEVAAESNAWIRSFSPFNAKSQHAFEKGEFGLLASLMFFDAPRDQLRTGTDLMTIFFVVDEYTDVEAAPRVREIVDVCIDAVRNPGKPRPDGEVILSEVIREFWERGRKTVPHPTGEPFVAAFINYLEGVADQAEARDRGGFLTIDAYLGIRREDAGARPLVALGALFLSVPDHVYDDPLLARLEDLCCDLIAIDNDLLSYNREQASGIGDFSIITLAMHHNQLSLHDAAVWIVEKAGELEAEFLQCYSEILASNRMSLDGIMQRYMDHIGNMRSSTWCWSFECKRYFGERGPTYARFGAVPLIPKKIRDPNLRENRVDVLLMEEELAKI